LIDLGILQRRVHQLLERRRGMVAVRVGAGLVVLAVVALAAPAQGQLGIQDPEGATPVTLYMHLLDIQDFPINTQKPQDVWDGSGPAFVGQSLTCGPPIPMVNLAQDNHRYYGYSSPSYVEYWFEMDGKPRTHPERGLGSDIRFDGQAPLLLRWYVETTAPDQFVLPLGSVPQAIPGVVVQATLRASDSVSVDDSAYDQGPVIAQGRSASAVLAADATQGAEHTMVDGHHVYGLSVPMALEQDTISNKTGYSLRIDVFIDNAVCDGQDGKAMSGTVQPYTDPEHRPRIEAAAYHQLRIDRLAPRFGPNETVEIQANVTAAWGAYDLDEGNVTLEVEGPDGSVDVRRTRFIQRLSEHHHVTEPIRATWTIDRDGLPSGLYTVRLNVTNDQHTATAHATAAFSLGPDAVYPVVAGEPFPSMGGGQAMPASGGLVLAVLLMLGALLRRPFGNR
jgi:hypothetical protein